MTKIAGAAVSLRKTELLEDLGNAKSTQYSIGYRHALSKVVSCFGAYTLMDNNTVAKSTFTGGQTRKMLGYQQAINIGMSIDF